MAVLLALFVPLKILLVLLYLSARFSKNPPQH